MDHLVFDSSGQLTSQTNSAYQPRITYQGMWLDPASDLYYDKARWYNAVDSVFMSPDPLGFAGGQTNLNEFVRNSPTNNTDPSGMEVASNSAATNPYDPNDPRCDGRVVGVSSSASGGTDIPVLGPGPTALQPASSLTVPPIVVPTLYGTLGGQNIQLSGPNIQPYSAGTWLITVNQDGTFSGFSLTGGTGSGAGTLNGIFVPAGDYVVTFSLTPPTPPTPPALIAPMDPFDAAGWGTYGSLSKPGAGL